MRQFKSIFYLVLLSGFIVSMFSQEKVGLSPIERSGFKKTTSYNDVIEYIDKLSANYPKIKVEVIGKSVQNRKIQMIHFVSSDSGNKIKVLLFCQQHGNEPAGKEMALMLLNKIANGREETILSNIDLYIMPLTNPDGNEAGKRANADGEDMNRNHLLLSQPEVFAIHKAYTTIDPDVTLDIHEYSAFRKEFREAGYVRTDDEEFGAPTNPNISLNIRNFAVNELFPFLNSELSKQGVSFSNYYKMNGPNDTVRASTTSIDDGRQSLAILGSFSFILEGRDGRKMNDDLNRRVTKELIAVEKFLEFVNQHSIKIKSLVTNEKIRLKESLDPVALNMDYVYDGEQIDMNMQKLDSGENTVMHLPYSPVVKVMETVNRPQAYLIPKALKNVVELLDRHGIKYYATNKKLSLPVEIYSILGKKGVWMENKSFSLPITKIRKETITTEPGDIIVPVKQRAGTLIVIALEPNSMWGLSQYDEFDSLCKKGNDYPIYRVPLFNASNER